MQCDLQRARGAQRKSTHSDLVGGAGFLESLPKGVALRLKGCD